MRVPFLLWLPIFVLATTVTGQAATTVTLSPTAGHPTTLVSISGTGFADNEAVDVYVDTVDTLLLVSSSTGTISGSVTIPASAAPGTHDITAIGRHSGDAAQTTFDVGSPWSQFGYSSAHVSANPWENVLSPSNVAAIGPKWVNAGGSFGSVGATVAVNFGDVYVATNNGIEALSSSTGAVLWSNTTPGFLYGSPTLSGSVVYVASTSGTVYALNATTGAKIWSAAPSAGLAFYSSVAIANGIVYVSASSGVVYALNASTGKTLWSYTISGNFDASPTVVNGVVYIGSQNDTVYALNASTGALLWSYLTAGRVESTIAVANGVAYVGSDDDNVYALAAQGPAPGSLLWKTTTGAAVYASPAVANDTIFIGSSDDNLYALDAHTGTVKWSLGTGATVRSAAVADGVVYVTSSNNTFYAVDAANGGILATAVTGLTYFGSPSISDGVAYVSTLGSGIYAFSLPPNLNTNAVHRAGTTLPASLHPDLRLHVSP